MTDALAFQAPDRFAAHARWLDGFLGRGRVATLLEALERGVGDHALDAARDVRAVLEKMGPVPLS